jgi:hypothetical protein
MKPEGLPTPPQFKPVDEFEQQRVIRDGIVPSSLSGAESNQGAFLSRTPEVSAPHAADIAETLGTLSVKEAINLDWQTIEETTKAESAKKAKNTILAKATKYGSYTPSVAEAITSHYDETVEFVGPSAAQIKQENVMYRAISGFLGFFSDSWASSFDAFLERQARQKIINVARRVTAPLDVIASVPNPKEQFVDEVHRLYQHLQGEATPSQQGPEERLYHVARQMSEYSVQQPGAEAVPEEDYPLLGKALPKAGYRPARSFEKLRAIRAATPEIMQGMARFLTSQGVEVVSPELQPFRSATRRIMQRFFPKKMARLPDEVDHALQRVYRSLPEDGARFTESIKILCRRITQLSHQGVEGKTITQALLKDMRKN